MAALFSANSIKYTLHLFCWLSFYSPKSVSHFHLAESQINKVWIILWGASFCLLKTHLFAVISHLFVCSAKTGWGLLRMILAAGAHFYLKSLWREKKCKLKTPDTAAKNLSFLQILWRCKNESRKINLGLTKRLNDFTLFRELSFNGMKLSKFRTWKLLN